MMVSLVVNIIDCSATVIGHENNESERIIPNKLYSVNCVHIASSSKNMTVLGSLKVFDEGIL